MRTWVRPRRPARSRTTTSWRSRGERPTDDVKRETWRVVLLAWLSSRVFFFVTGALGTHLLRHTATNYPAEQPGVLKYWAYWDGAWFSGIATHGYFGTLWPSSANFFPFYPLLLRLGTALGPGPSLAGVVISSAATLAALFFAYELALDFFDRRTAIAATTALAFFPTAFYLNAVYSEAIFLAAALGALWAARLRGDFVLAGSLGCIAALTRNIGVLLVLPLVEEWFRQRRSVGKVALAPLALIPAGLLAYMFWLWRWSRDPLLFSTVVHRTWGRTPTNPVHTLGRAWDAARAGAVWVAHPDRIFTAANANPSYTVMGTIDFACLMLVVALLVVVVARLPVGLAAYAVAAVLLPVLTPPQILALASFSRYALSAFPIFFALGFVVVRTRLLVPWFLVSGAFGVLLTLEFTTNRWVG
jgi:Mannosyltransferase (PIG-V)